DDTTYSVCQFSPAENALPLDELVKMVGFRTQPSGFSPVKPPWKNCGTGFDAMTAICAAPAIPTAAALIQFGNALVTAKAVLIPACRISAFCCAFHARSFSFRSKASYLSLIAFFCASVRFAAL